MKNILTFTVTYSPIYDQKHSVETGNVYLDLISKIGLQIMTFLWKLRKKDALSWQLLSVFRLFTVQVDNLRGGIHILQMCPRKTITFQ